MKTIHVLLLISFITGELFGYTMDEEQPILSCPECNRPILRPESAQSVYVRFEEDSCNTVWSDLVYSCVEWPVYPYLVKCPRCNTVFWVEDAAVIGDKWTDERTANMAIDCRLPIEPEYYKAAEASDLSGPREIFARRCGWRLANDLRRREDASQSDTLTTTAQSNLSELILLLDDDSPEERVLKAEALRELGRFGECLNVTKDMTNGKLAYIAGQIRILARHRDSRLSLLRRH